MQAVNFRRICQIYTRWIIGDEVHNSEPQNVKSIKEVVNFNDHHCLPIKATVAPQIVGVFLDMPFEVQLRGIRATPIYKEPPKFFGYKRGDYEFGINTSRKKNIDMDVDILIAQTDIDGRIFTKGVNKYLQGEYPLFPPAVKVGLLHRDAICTNDINLIKASVSPDLVVPSFVILQAQMTLEVSMGYVGCKSHKLVDSFSRLYCLIHDTECIMAILRTITEINEEMLQANMKDDALTGFTLDAGSVVFLYVEGPSDGEILRIWDMTADFYPNVKPVFSTSARYSTRIYSELLLAAMPFYIMKMYVPLGVLLACPPIYVRPALPLPTRSALLKLGRLIAGKLQLAPRRSAMPTTAELRSLRLELCVTPKPISQLQNEETQTKVMNGPQSMNSLQRIINWENK